MTGWFHFLFERWLSPIACFFYDHDFEMYDHHFNVCYRCGKKVPVLCERPSNADG